MTISLRFLWKIRYIRCGAIFLLNPITDLGCVERLRDDPIDPPDVLHGQALRYLAAVSGGGYLLSSLLSAVVLHHVYVLWGSLFRKHCHGNRYPYWSSKAPSLAMSWRTKARILRRRQTFVLLGKVPVGIRCFVFSSMGFHMPKKWTSWNFPKKSCFHDLNTICWSHFLHLSSIINVVVSCFPCVPVIHGNSGSRLVQRDCCQDHCANATKCGQLRAWFLAFLGRKKAGHGKLSYSISRSKRNPQDSFEWHKIYELKLNDSGKTYVYIMKYGEAKTN